MIEFLRKSLAYDILDYQNAYITDSYLKIMLNNDDR